MFMEVIISVITRKKVHMNTCLIVNGYRDRTRRRKNQQMTQIKIFIHFRLTQHVSGIIMPIVRRTDYKTACGVRLDVLAAVVWS
jgi:hypothetical protein